MNQSIEPTWSAFDEILKSGRKWDILRIPFNRKTSSSESVKNIGRKMDDKKTEITGRKRKRFKWK